MQSKSKARATQEQSKAIAKQDREKRARTLSVPYAKPGRMADDGKRSLDRLGVVCQVVRPLWGEGGLEGEGRLRLCRWRADLNADRL